MHRFQLVSILLLAGIVVSVMLNDSRSASELGQVELPAPEAPQKSERCVEPTDLMRRDHMKFLLHQRDATVIEGERGTKYSLTGCIECHNPKIADQPVVRYENPQHFCASCHEFASVKHDCFECHADVGQGPL